MKVSGTMNAVEAEATLFNDEKPEAVQAENEDPVNTKNFIINIITTVGVNPRVTRTITRLGTASTEFCCRAGNSGETKSAKQGNVHVNKVSKFR